MTEKRLTWGQRIKAAKAKIGTSEDSFTWEDRVDAADWASCAVGENLPKAADRIDRGFLVGRKTAHAETLGMAFMEAVQEDDVALAASIYRQIRALRKELK